MRKPKLVEDYHKVLNDTASPFAHDVVTKTSTSPFIIKGVDVVKELSAALGDYDKNVTAIVYPNPAETAQRDLLRTAVLDELGRLAKSLNLDYSGNEVALLSSGLTMVDTGAGRAARAALLSGAIMSFELFDGHTAGCLLLKLKRPTGTVQNLIRYTTDEKLDSRFWEVAVGGGRECELGPFPSGTRVWVMVAALIGSTTDPQYAAVQSRLVQ